MNVNRIEPVSINTIQWQLLTARQILDYKNSGTQVPDVYLTWAQNFISSVNAKDVDTVTYATANAVGGDKNLTKTEETNEEEKINEESEKHKTQQVQDSSQGNIQNVDPSLAGQLIVPVDSAASQSDETSSDSDDKFNGDKAKILRAKMEESKVDIRTLALNFIGLSAQSTLQAALSVLKMDDSSSKSDEEIQALTSNIEELINEIRSKQEELKNEVKKINNDESNESSIDKVNRLQEQIKALGIEGQNEISSGVADLTSLLEDVISQTETIQDTNDFGVETVDIGTQLLKMLSFTEFGYMMNRVIGNKAVVTGKIAIDESQTAEDVQSKTQISENKNISDAKDLANPVRDETGIGATYIQNNNNNKNENNNNENSENDLLVTVKKKAQEKLDPDNKQNDLAMRNDPINKEETYNNDEFKKYYENVESLDAIIKRKIRKGEDINQTPL